MRHRSVASSRYDSSTTYIYLKLWSQAYNHSNIYVDVCDSLSEIHTVPINESQRGTNANSCVYSSILRNQPARYEKDISAKCVRTEASCLNVQVDTQSR